VRSMQLIHRLSICAKQNVLLLVSFALLWASTAHELVGVLGGQESAGCAYGPTEHCPSTMSRRCTDARA
jgi:hypothetical protein